MYTIPIPISKEAAARLELNELQLNLNALQGNAEAQYQLAMNYLVRHLKKLNKPVDAKTINKFLALFPNPEEKQFVQSFGLETPMGMAGLLFQLAANQKHPKAQCQLALFYINFLEKKHTDDMVVLLLRSVEKHGDAQSQYALAAHHERLALSSEAPDNVHHEKEAIQWLEKAAHQDLNRPGYPGAQDNLGHRYAEGDGVKQDLAKAKQLFLWAANNWAAKSEPEKARASFVEHQTAVVRLKMSAAVVAPQKFEEKTEAPTPSPIKTQIPSTPPEASEEQALAAKQAQQALEEEKLAAASQQRLEAAQKERDRKEREKAKKQRKKEEKKRKKELEAADDSPSSERTSSVDSSLPQNNTAIDSPLVIQNAVLISQDSSPSTSTEVKDTPLENLSTKPTALEQPQTAEQERTEAAATATNAIQKLTAQNKKQRRRNARKEAKKTNEQKRKKETPQKITNEPIASSQEQMQDTQVQNDSKIGDKKLDKAVKTAEELNKNNTAITQDNVAVNSSSSPSAPASESTEVKDIPLPASNEPANEPVAVSPSPQEKMQQDVPAENDSETEDEKSDDAVKTADAPVAEVPQPPSQTATQPPENLSTIIQTEWGQNQTAEQFSPIPQYWDVCGTAQWHTQQAAQARGEVEKWEIVRLRHREAQATCGQPQKREWHRQEANLAAVQAAHWQNLAHQQNSEAKIAYHQEAIQQLQNQNMWIADNFYPPKQHYLPNPQDCWIEQPQSQPLNFYPVVMQPAPCLVVNPPPQPIAQHLATQGFWGSRGRGRRNHNASRTQNHRQRHAENSVRQTAAHQTPSGVIP